MLARCHWDGCHSPDVKIQLIFKSPPAPPVPVASRLPQFLLQSERALEARGSSQVTSTGGQERPAGRGAQTRKGIPCLHPAPPPAVPSREWGGNLHDLTSLFTSPPQCFLIPITHSTNLLTAGAVHSTAVLRGMCPMPLPHFDSQCPQLSNVDHDAARAALGMKGKNRSKKCYQV